MLAIGIGIGIFVIGWVFGSNMGFKAGYFLAIEDTKKILENYEKELTVEESLKLLKGSDEKSSN